MKNNQNHISEHMYSIQNKSINRQIKSLIKTKDCENYKHLFLQLNFVTSE